MGLDNCVTISFVGDIYLGDRPCISLSPEVDEVLAECDLVVGNQEGAMTDCEEAIGGKCCLKSGPESARILCNWGIDVVSLANNHMFDYGWEGFEQTRRELDEAGIRYLGADEDLGKASRPLIVDVKGIRVGLLAYSWEFVQTTCASEDSYGCAPLDKELMNKQVREVKSQVDEVIVLLHWGYCEYPIPTPEQVGTAEGLFDAGATAVIGHHSHVVQPVMSRDGKLAAFSLGNFAFAEYSDRGRVVRMSRDDTEGMILILRLAPGRIISYDLVYTVLRDSFVQVDNSQRRVKEFAERCGLLMSPDYSRYWRQFVRWRMIKRVFYWANFFNWRYIHKETLMGGWLMLKDIFRPGKR